MLSRLYNDIPIGREKAVTKNDLMRKWDKPERAVRRIIQELRMVDNGDDYVIVSFSGGKGYYRTNDLEEIEAFKRETIRRAQHTFAPLRKINRILEHSEGQQLEFDMDFLSNFEADYMAEYLSF